MKPVLLLVDLQNDFLRRAEVEPHPDAALIDRFLRRAQAGILKVNSSTADAAVHLRFGGWKAPELGHQNIIRRTTNFLLVGRQHIFLPANRTVKL